MPQSFVSRQAVVGGAVSELAGKRRWLQRVVRSCGSRLRDSQLRRGGDARQLVGGPDAVRRYTPRPSVSPNFEMLKQSWEDQLAQLNKVFLFKKADVAKFTTSLGAWEAEPSEAGKSFAAVVASKNAVNSRCVQVAFGHEVSVKVVVKVLMA